MGEAAVRPAAGQPTYEVRELLEGDPPVDLGLLHGCDDYLDAVDFAFDFLQDRDPQREGLVSALVIVKVAADRREPVWTYSHSRAEEEKDLVGVYAATACRAWTLPATPALAAATPARSRLARPLPRHARAGNWS